MTSMNPLPLLGAVPVELELFPVRVDSVLQVATDITAFRLKSLDGKQMPSFDPGSHITVKTPSGVSRQYSLCGDPEGGDFWQIAVKREGRGRGGSLSLVDGVKAGAELMISNPKNSFFLEIEAKQYLFIAGGIGITPIFSMLQSLAAKENFNPKLIKLIYLTRDPASSAFLEDIHNLLPDSSLVVHHDQGNLAEQYDLWDFFEKPNQSLVYCCGPKPLMDAVQDMSGHWPQKQIRFERFAADTAPKLTDETFQVTVASTGLTVDVEPRVTILDALRANGVHIPSSCESGTCGTCKTRLIDGVADHRDSVLLEDETHGIK